MSSTTDEVVSTATGCESFIAPVTRSSCWRNCGMVSGTAMNPASMAPRNPMMYSRPCGARITARSPGEPRVASFAATTRTRWCTSDQVSVSAVPVGSAS